MTIEIEGILALGSATRPASLHLGSAGIAGNGLVITRPIDLISPQVLRAAAVQLALPAAELCVVAADSTVKTYTFRNLFIVSARQTASPPEETITLNFVEMTPPVGMTVPTGLILGAARGLPATFTTVFTSTLASPPRTEQVSALGLSIDRGATGRPVLTLTLRGIARGLPLQDVQAVAASGYGKGGDAYSRIVISLADASCNLRYPSVAEYVLRGVTLSVTPDGITKLTYQDFDFVALAPPTPTTAAGRVSWNVKTNTTG